MVNDTSTLSGSLDEMKDQLISELGDKGVTATFDSSTGLLGLVSKIGDIQTGGGGGCPQLVTGTFTTGSTGGSTATETIPYTGNGYPILTIVEVDGGMYNDTSSGNIDWYNSKNRYDVGQVTITKARTNTAPTYQNSGADNYGVVTYIYKSSSTTATSYSLGGSQTANSYTGTNNPTSGNTCVRFKGNGKTLAYYIGNRTSSTYGLARSTQYRYTILYSQ